jgi:hypothetical protein
MRDGPRVRQRPEKVDGALPRDIVRRYFRRKGAALRACGQAPPSFTTPSFAYAWRASLKASSCRKAAAATRVEAPLELKRFGAEKATDRP